jgi:hypothetical protein
MAFPKAPTKSTSPGKPPGAFQPNKQPFYGTKGADPNAVMKNDFQQQVPYSTAPSTKPARPKVKSGGVYSLAKTRR